MPYYKIFFEKSTKLQDFYKEKMVDCLKTAHL